eukprot:8378416-Pyramimonas_sp.AAC.1
MHSSQRHAELHFGHTLEHRARAGRRHDPPGLRAFPGQRLPARGGQIGPAFQQLSRIEKLPAVLSDNGRGDSRANPPELE